MALESATYVGELVTTNPVGATDQRSTADDHLRLLKATLQATFPGMAGAFARAQDKGGTYTVVANDNTSLIRATAGITLNLTAAATLGNKHWFAVEANGGAVTVDPNLTEQINGATTLTVPQGTFAMIWCNGTAFFAFLASKTLTTFALGLLDDADSAAARTTLSADGNKVATDLTNLGHPVNARLVTAATGTLAVNVHRGEAGTVPTAANPISVAMRSSTTLGTQGLVTRLITAAPNLTIASGATMGHQSTVPQDLYWYLIDNAGTIELAASSTYFGISGIASTTAMSATADSVTVMYSTTARTNVPYLLFARTVHTEASPGTWSNEPNEIYYAPFDITPPVTTPLSGFRNKVIGGDFTTNPWQRGTSFTAPATTAITADCWKLAYVTSAVVDVLKTADAPTPAQTGGHFTQHCLHIDVTTADASIAATDQMNLSQIIEGFNAAPFGFGQAGTRYVTLSFWVKGAKTGIHCVSLINSASDRSYVKEYTINVADTWERKILTFPVDTSGTWLYDTGSGLRVRFSLAAGSNFHTTADTWAAGNFMATSNQVNELDNTANNFKIALVQLEAGTVATPFEARSVGEELALCRRYLPTLKAGDVTSSYVSPGQCTTTTGGLTHIPFPVPTRIAVTGVTVSAASDFQVLNAAGTGLACTSLTFGTGNTLGAALTFGVASGLVAGNATVLYAANANSQLIFTGAEL
jgi:hypothetical protein